MRQMLLPFKLHGSSAEATTVGSSGFRLARQWLAMCVVASGAAEVVKVKGVRPAPGRAG